MKLNSKILKETICNYLKEHPGHIAGLFDPADRGGIDELELLNPKVWKRVYKEQGGDTIARCFEPSGSRQEALQDSITAEVITNADDTQIISLTVEG